jgi:minor extracellular serine protease Vpr
VSRRALLPLLSLLALAGTSVSAHAASEMVVQLRGGAVGARAPLSALRDSEGHLSAQRPATRHALAQIATEQRSAARALRRAVPGIVVTAHLQYSLDALVVMAPSSSIARLARVRGVQHVFRSATFHVETDRVPTVIDATPLWNPTPFFPGGSRGQGVRIGIIDDGIDISRPSFAGEGYTYPPGFPKGLARGVNGKVIVARAFAPPGSGPRERTAFDPDGSDHGTHVAGIAAGESGISATVDGVKIPNLSGVAPDAYLGNYRVLTTPTPTFGLDGNGAEIARAIDRAVADGMDVLNLSLGEPEVGPGDDLVEHAIGGAARAGVTTVVAAGNEGDEGGFGTISSPGSAAAAITVAAVTNDRIFALPLTVTDSPAPPFPVIAGPNPIPSSWGAGLTLQVSPACGSGTAAGSLVLVFLNAKCDARQAGAAVALTGGAGLVLSTLGQGDPRITDASGLSGGDIPGVVISRRMAAALQAAVAAAGGSSRVTVGNVTQSLGSGNGGLTTSFSSLGPAPISLRLKPDVAAPGEGVLSTVPGGYAIWDGTSMASPAVAGAAALLHQRHPRWKPADIRSALELTARPAYDGPSRAVEALPLAVGSGLIDVSAADVSPLLSPQASANFGLVRAPSSHTVRVELRDAGSGAGTWKVSARGLHAPAALVVPSGGEVALALTLDLRAAASRGNRQGFVTLTHGAQAVRIRWWGYVERPRLGASPIRQVAVGTVSGDTRKGTLLAARYGYPASPAQLGLPSRYPGHEQVLSFRVKRGARNAGVRVIDGAVDPQMLLAPNENRLAGETALDLVENPYLERYGDRVPVSALLLPTAGRYYVSVETRPGSPPGRYRLRTWVDDATPPSIKLVSKVLFGSSPVLQLVIRDNQSGFDPDSLSVTVDGNAVGHVQVSGSSVSVELGKLSRGRHRVRISAADYQELKNSENADERPLPNTRVVAAHVAVR